MFQFVSAEPQAVNIRTWVKDCYLVLDSGTGMSSTIKVSLYMPMYQLESTLNHEEHPHELPSASSLAHELLKEIPRKHEEVSVWILTSGRYYFLAIVM